MGSKFSRSNKNKQGYSQVKTSDYEDKKNYELSKKDDDFYKKNYNTNYQTNNKINNSNLDNKYDKFSKSNYSSYHTKSYDKTERLDRHKDYDYYDQMKLIKKHEYFGGKDISISGKQFNEIYKGVKFVKLMNKTGTHNGYLFKFGLNVDTNRFLCDRAIGEDGLYFCREDDYVDWIDSDKSNPKYWIFDIEIPDNARVVIINKSMKADRFIVKNRRLLHDQINSMILSIIYSEMSKKRIIDELSKIPLSIYNEIQDKLLLHYRFVELGLDVSKIFKK